MKILVCGKGGSGKSTITSLLAKKAANKGYKVLVVDMDESNFGLHKQLGVKLPEGLMNFFGGKKSIAEKLLTSVKQRKGEVKIFNEKWRLKDLPKEYLAEKNGIKLLTIGKIHGFGEGCACPMGALTRVFLENLELDEHEVVFVDTDAGIEHFGRGVEAGCDVVLVVLDPTYESIQLSKKISQMAKTIGKKVYFILNKVDEESRDLMLSFLDKNMVVGVIPQNKEIFRACLVGEELKLDLEEVEKILTNISL